MKFRRWICAALIAALLLSAAALADAPALSDSLFSSAKEAVVCMASGEYERMVTLLPFSDVAPSASEWASFAKNYGDLSNVQSDYAVAFWWSNIWVLVVPIQAPDDGSVEVLALSSDDGKSFSGYRYATWSQVEKALGDSDRVLWNKEYVGGTPTLFAD